VNGMVCMEWAHCTQGVAIKAGRHACAVLAATLLLAGCKDFWQTSSTGSGCTNNCVTVSSGPFYVLNTSPGQVEIAGYSMISGKLAALPGSPYGLPSGPHAIAIAPNNSFLYVSTQTGVYLYTIGAGGALTLTSTTPISTDFAAYSMQVDATNSWLLDASGTGYLYAIPISPTTGKATSAVQQVSLAGIAPRQLVISPDNKNIFVALGSSGTEVVPFTAANADPLPTSAGIPIAVKEVAGAAVSVAVDPANLLFYIGETGGGTGSTNTGILRAFTYSSVAGTPSEIAGSPYASGGLTPVSILPVTSGSYVYVANAMVSNSTTGSISGFGVNAAGTAYSLRLLGTMASTGITPNGLAEDSNGAVALLVNTGGGPDLDIYSFDSTTAGKLDLVLSASTGTDPVGALAIAAAP